MNNNNSNSNVSSGIGVGSVIAILISWSINQSVLWCIIHGLFGWLYVIYYLCGFAGKL